MIPLMLLDDNPAHNELLETLLRQLVEEENLDASVVMTATDARELIDYAKENPSSGIYFLDIELERDINGVEACKAIHEYDPQAHVVYVSAYPHYAMECIRSHAFDFLLKPFTREDLGECLRAILRDKYARTYVAPVSIQLGSRTVLLDQDEIRYITKLGNFLVAATARGELKWRGSQGTLLESLDSAAFYPISRSCTINLNHVHDVNWKENKIVMDDGVSLILSRRMRAGLKARMDAMWRIV